MNNLENMETSRSCLVYSTWSRKVYCTLRILSTVIVFLFCLLISTTSAGGDCWAQRSHGFNTCNTLLKKNVTKEQCCKYSGEGISWTEESYSYSDIFKLTNLQNGVPNCQPCRDSCDQIDCGSDKRCVMKAGKPRCVCSPSCSKAKEDVPRVNVCATDGRTYKNMCSMLKEKCRTGRLIEMAYFGTCKASCEGVICPKQERCVEDQFGRPHCVSCYSYCPQAVEEAFVCGDDDITYESLCQLKRTECIQGTVINYQRGKCENLTTCDDLNCVEKKSCVMDGDEPVCVVCEFQCYGWRSRVPICASDGVTYNNWCHLREHMCNISEYLEIEGLGICGDGVLYEAPEEGSGFSADDNSIFFQKFLGANDGIYPLGDEDIPDVNSTINNDYVEDENITATPIYMELNEGDEEPFDPLARFEQQLRNNDNHRNGNGNKRNGNGNQRNGN
ncbi:follistatin-A-like isoform X2 [Amphiura filiformis]|uniref:follistatin-A-like isoform X2 n=1 Tax=Amphiura filiformis TaxID=82378 RepID=UPI003B214C44